jgi:hypothetical protein
MRTRLLSLALLSGGLALALFGGRSPAQADFEAYKKVVADTAGMVGDAEARRLAGKHGLNVLNITWEDTGRFHNSAVGPNISDVTIQVQQKDPQTGNAFLTCMPVIRFPNFADKTADVRMDKFFLLVGNEKGDELKRVSLTQYLGNFRKYLSKPGSWKGNNTYLLASRDNHVLVSAQACFLPVPKKGIAEFNPVLFNYQSRPGDPAVLAILVTPEGTSATIIDNQRDRFSAGGGVWGQRLFVNKKGERASLTGQRISDYKKEKKARKGEKDEPKSGPGAEAAGEKGLNMVLLIQVPLKQKEQPVRGLGAPTLAAPAMMFKMAAQEKAKEALKSDVEEAVIGSGKVEGPFTEIDNLPIERDERFPVRVTVQFYKATSNGVVEGKDLDEIAKQIKRVYDQGDYVGSLVLDGRKGRPTEHDGEQVQPPDWWQKFWADYHQRTGRTRAEAIVEVRKAKGEEWVPLTERALADEAEALAPMPGHGPLPHFLRKYGVYLGAGAAAVLLLVVGVLLARRRAASAS